MAEMKKSIQGAVLRAEDSDFEEGVRAAIDYRGDVTITLQDGSQVIGFVFNGENEVLDLFPIHGSQKESVSLKDVARIEFSGEDAAYGKSWEDWVQKRTKEPQAHT